MKKWLPVALMAALMLAIAPAALAAGVSKARPGTATNTPRFQCAGTIVSVDAVAKTFDVKVKTISSAWRGARAFRGAVKTVAVTADTKIFFRQQAANGHLSATRPLTLADLKKNCVVHISGTVDKTSGALTAKRVVMFVRTFKFQCNATIVSVSAADAPEKTFVVELKTMSRSWHHWIPVRNVRGDRITIVVLDTTKIFTRQLGTTADPVPATFASLVAGNKVHIGGTVTADDAAHPLYNASRIVEFLPAAPTP